MLPHQHGHARPSPSDDHHHRMPIAFRSPTPTLRLLPHPLPVRRRRLVHGNPSSKALPPGRPRGNDACTSGALLRCNHLQLDPSTTMVFGVALAARRRSSYYPVAPPPSQGGSAIVSSPSSPATSSHYPPCLFVTLHWARSCHCAAGARRTASAPTQTSRPSPVTRFLGLVFRSADVVVAVVTDDSLGSRRDPLVSPTARGGASAPRELPRSTARPGPRRARH